MPLSIAVGAVSWYLVERPMIRLAHRYAPDPRDQLIGPRPFGTMPRVRGFHVGLAFISVVGLLYRIWYVVWERGRLKLNGDAAYYHWQANDLAHGLWFIDPGQYHWYGRITPSAGHPPVYLLYLAGVSRVHRSERAHAPRSRRAFSAAPRSS